jgi:hypothetical protein
VEIWRYWSDFNLDFQFIMAGHPSHFNIDVEERNLEAPDALGLGD